MNYNISYHPSESFSHISTASASSGRQLHQAEIRHFPIKHLLCNGIIHTTIRTSEDKIILINNKRNDHSQHFQLTSSRSVDIHNQNEHLTSIRHQNSIKSVKNKVQPVNVHRNNQFSNNAFTDDYLNKDLQKQNNWLATVGNQGTVQQIHGFRKSTYTNVNSLKPTVVNQHFSIASVDFHRLNDGSGVTNQNKSSLFSRRRSMGESNLQFNKRRKKKDFNGQCCQCSPLSAFLSILAALLIAVIIAALLVSLIQPKTTSTTTTSTTTTATTKTTTSTTTTSTTTTTPRPLLKITQTSDPVAGLYNTTAGGSTGGYEGRYSNFSEHPPQAIDGSLITKYVNYGNNGSLSVIIYQPGINTGFYVTPSISAASIALGLRFAAGNDFSERDPLTVTLEGTNSTALNSSVSWTLLYNGPSGLDPVNIPGRSTYGILQNFSNTNAFQSYRLLVTLQRNDSDCTQYSEAEIWGYY